MDQKQFNDRDQLKKAALQLISGLRPVLPAIEGKDKLLEYMRLTKAENWNLLYSEIGSRIGSYADTNNSGKAVTFLELMLNLLSPGIYYIESYKHGSVKNWNRTFFYLEELP